MPVAIVVRQLLREDVAERHQHPARHRTPAACSATESVPDERPRAITLQDRPTFGRAIRLLLAGLLDPAEPSLARDRSERLECQGEVVIDEGSDDGGQHVRVAVTGGGVQSEDLGHPAKLLLVPQPACAATRGAHYVVARGANVSATHLDTGYEPHAGYAKAGKDSRIARSARSAGSPRIRRPPEQGPYLSRSVSKRYLTRY